MLREEYPQGIDVAYEGVGGRLRQAVVQNLTPQGRLLGVGYISSYPPHQRLCSEWCVDQPARFLNTDVHWSVQGSTTSSMHLALACLFGVGTT